MSKRPIPELIDKENPEWGPDEFARARPFRDVVRERFGDKDAEEILRPRGRPKAAQTKVPVSLRIDAGTLEAWKATGKGWQTRMAKLLCEQAPGHL